MQQSRTGELVHKSPGGLYRDKQLGAFSKRDCKPLLTIRQGPWILNLHCSAVDGHANSAHLNPLILTPAFPDTAFPGGVQSPSFSTRNDGHRECRPGISIATPQVLASGDAGFTTVGNSRLWTVPTDNSDQTRLDGGGVGGGWWGGLCVLLPTISSIDPQVQLPASPIESVNGGCVGPLAASLEADPCVVRHLKGKIERVPATQPSIDSDVEGAIREFAAHLAPPVAVEQCWPNRIAHGSGWGRR